MKSHPYLRFRSLFRRSFGRRRASQRGLALAGAGLLLVNALIAADSAVIDLTDGSPAKGVRVVPEFSGQPEDGVLATFQIALPAHGQGCYFSADDTGVPGYPILPGNANRVLPWIISGDGTGLFRPGYIQNPIARAPRRMGMFALYQLQTGGVLALLPITGPATAAWLEIAEDGRLLLRAGTFGTDPYRGRLPLLAWAKGDNVYQACYDAWAQAIGCPDVGGRTAWREEKTYPEPMRYLGWCTYEEYKFDFDSDLLVKVAEGLENSGIPIRWFLVDEGFQKGQPEKHLQSLAPDPVKFPQGWKPLMAKRDPDKIRWFGLWHCFQGLWKYIDPHNDFTPELRSHLMTMPEGMLLPRDNPASAAAFYDALIGSVKEYGFDFVKIDVQSSNLAAYYGRGNAVRAAADNAQALEDAVHRDQDGMINCMAQNPVCVFNTRYSAVTRCSIDYHKDNLAEIRSHILQSYANTLWMGQTVWPDHDEFHSSDPVGGRLMAVSKALSGGPVYLSDAPQALVGEFIRPLCYEDGELLRPLAPAVPLPESAFADVLNEPVAYRVIAPLANGAAAVALYNLNVGEETTVPGAVRAEDYRDAGGMMQPHAGRWAVPPEGLVAYDWFAGRGGKLEEKWETTLHGFADALVLLTPIRQGWSVIGRADKYLAPAAIASCEESREKLVLTLRESGPLLVYSLQRPRTDLGTVTAQPGNIWRIELPVGRRDYQVVLHR